MDNHKAAEVLQSLANEAHGVPVVGPDFESWRYRATVALSRGLGTAHELTASFRALEFPYESRPLNYAYDAAELVAFNRDRSAAIGILSAGIFELKELSAPTEPPTAEVYDAELWTHVVHSHREEKWDQVASQAAIFTESRVRAWAGLADQLHGVDLWSTVLKPDGGKFPLGYSSPEHEGWHLLGLGLTKALRNVDTHRIQTRADAKRYALGVLGLCSLLLTQLRHQHSNSFVDEQPIGS